MPYFVEASANVRNRIDRRHTEKIYDTSFKIMSWLFKVVGFHYPYMKKRVEKFDIKNEMAAVDYGCAPGRHFIKLAKFVGERRQVVGYEADSYFAFNIWQSTR